MKATYRAKLNALVAMNDGYQLITIRRGNDNVIVYLDDILDTTNGEKVQEYGGHGKKYNLANINHMGYRELMNYSE